MTRLMLFLVLTTVLESSTVLADQNDPELEPLFRSLRDTRDPGAAAPLEARIWELWMQHADPAANQLMLQGILQTNTNAIGAAVNTYSQLITAHPDFAEAWNKRATLYYLMGNYPASKADIGQVLKLEPYHFGALSGLGLVHVALGEFFLARTAFNSALEVNPSMMAVRANLQELERALRDQAI